MKELHKLITKDIFDCLSEEDAGRLRELRAELHIDDEAYRQMKKMITSREVHDRIMEVRKKPSRMIKMMRYAAILILPVAIAAYIFISQGNVIKPEIVVQNQVEEKLPVPVRKQAMLVLEEVSSLFKIFLSERVKALVLSGCQYPCCCKQDDADEDDGCT